MKRKLFTSTFVFLLCFTMINTTLAQSPELIKYQAVLRDASGNVVANTAKTVIVEILQGSSSGTSVYQETHSITTTAQGVINLNIGGGTVNSGTFSSINWSTNSYWAKLTVDGTEITNGQLLSVPYALSIKGITSNPVNGNIGIGTSNPAFKLQVEGVIHADNSGGVCIRLGDDANLNDINIDNTLGVYGVQDGTQGHIKLGSNGPTISGKSGYLGLGVTSPVSLLDIYGTGSRENITLKSNAADFGPEIRLISTAASGHQWRMVSGASASNSFGAGSFELWDQTAGASRFGITADGKVGIGTTAPTAKLDVTGTVRIADGSQANGRILGCDANGTASWIAMSGVTPAVMATLSGTGNNITSLTGTYTGTTITLPPGKWSVQISILAIEGAGALACWIRSGLSTSSSSFVNTDVIGPTLASGYKASGAFGMINGTIIINNTSGVNKTYYYWTQTPAVYSGTFNLSNFGTSLCSENAIVAYPMN
jgi:hypothetical protein